MHMKLYSLGSKESLIDDSMENFRTFNTVAASRTVMDALSPRSWFASKWPFRIPEIWVNLSNIQNQLRIFYQAGSPGERSLQLMLSGGNDLYSLPQTYRPTASCNARLIRLRKSGGAITSTSAPKRSKSPINSRSSEYGISST